ncbi:prolyl-tRNA synthetase associated domain-containing protein [Thalassobaculum sp. OXR-137]|uniref:prolyl-tRNA synthetase associated domain-containing protein n=1 Tax=Thalassobaculum sp. OXR-137 TaxID=3100173 RepID=UPI002AC9CA3F|nr:prolyl-tRNA synthetase associated domain-containing protein [Thalassobaculum sp. OXR-137]WPZ35373.1 prolyl-tRNA synthetase associated domain-containing protein [Thalassobaculum sp. OXR-137]
MADSETPALPTSPEALLARLDALGIAYDLHTHPPLFTVEDSKALRGDLPGGHCKNLFLRDRKGAMWLVVCLEDRRIDLKALGSLLGGRLSFGSPDRLMATLGVIPGAVSPFALINDTGVSVTVILDAEMMGLSPLNYHPLSNEMTVAVAPDALTRFIESCGHAPQVLDLSAASGD